MVIANWNIDWPSPSSSRGSEILKRLKQLDPEIICLTEVRSDFAKFLSKHWSDNIIYSSARRWRSNWPSGMKGYKVLLCSKKPWKSPLGSGQLPEERFIGGTTRTSIGELAVAGVCIPYSFSRRQEGYDLWQDHEIFLTGLKEVLRQEIKRHKRLAVIGDFNQWLIECDYYRKVHRPEHIKKALHDALGPELKILTGHLKDISKDRANLDHVAINNQISAIRSGMIDNVYKDKELSKNHFGVYVELEPKVTF